MMYLTYYMYQCYDLEQRSMEAYQMETVSSADFQRNVGRIQDHALVEPVMVTRNGRERLVLLSAEEYRRLKQLDRQSLAAADLSDTDLAIIAAAEVPAEYGHLDDEFGL